eukprot:1158989-Pelagomonas_calceolata.AAC.3
MRNLLWQWQCKCDETWGLAAAKPSRCIPAYPSYCQTYMMPYWLSTLSNFSRWAQSNRLMSYIKPTLLLGLLEAWGASTHRTSF